MVLAALRAWPRQYRSVAQHTKERTMQNAVLDLSYNIAPCHSCCLNPSGRPGSAHFEAPLKNVHIKVAQTLHAPPTPCSWLHSTSLVTRFGPKLFLLLEPLRAEARRWLGARH